MPKRGMQDKLDSLHFLTEVSLCDTSCTTGRADLIDTKYFISKCCRRFLWLSGMTGAYIVLQDAVAQALVTAQDSEVMDGFPIPVAHGARSFPPGWLADIARIGKGGNDRYFYGVRMMLVISCQGGRHRLDSGRGQRPRTLVAELLLSARAGHPRLQGPLHPERHLPQVPPPNNHGAPLSVREPYPQPT
jgi:hypothetical protein